MFQGKGPKLADPEAWSRTGTQKDECDTVKSHIPWFRVIPGFFHGSLYTVYTNILCVDIFVKHENRCELLGWKSFESHKYR